MAEVIDPAVEAARHVWAVCIYNVPYLFPKLFSELIEHIREHPAVAVTYNRAIVTVSITEFLLHRSNL
jgi:hypothetical protein